MISTRTRSATTPFIPAVMLVVLVALAAFDPGVFWTGVRSASPSSAALTGIHKIQHVIIVMQENRSFDEYFGTYPGAEGIPAGTCVPDPANGGCVAPYHDTGDINPGGPHSSAAAVADIDGGKMDGFVAQAELGGSKQTGVMGYHNASEIPNYWSWAQNYVLQDHMFEPVASWSEPAHLYMVSGWSALCSDPSNVLTCVSAESHDTDPLDSHVRTKQDGDDTDPPLTPPNYSWTDLTYLLHKHGVSWKYYQAFGDGKNLLTATPEIWSPVRDFTTVHSDNQVSNVVDNSQYFADASAGTLPSVSWVLPSPLNSDHPLQRVSAAQAWVTSVVNAAMAGPDWSSTAIFVSWDDWGGFYDHVVPPKVDGQGYGLRVPGLMISPYARKGYIDKQTLSHDAYLKFIEDDFMGGHRIDPLTDGRWDPRPTVRENVSILGDLTSEFDFTQAITRPNPLPLYPVTGYALPNPVEPADGGVGGPLQDP